MILLSRIASFKSLICLLLLLIGVSDAMAARRGLRIDQVAWSEPVPIESCRGFTGGASLFLDGYTFFSGISPRDFKSYSYCQTANPYAEGLTTSEYLNREIFEDDEWDLADQIGSNRSANTRDNVTARKYTYLDQFGNGFQWTFYDFPEYTLVGFYSTSASQSPYIRSDPFTILWDETYRGEYFCFGPGDFFGLSEFGSSCYPYPPLGVPAAERDALVALYNNTGGSNWDLQQNWLEGDPCNDNWHGVICSNDYDEDTGIERPIVVALQLPSNNMNGSLPAELGDLTYLYLLELTDNRIFGVIPTELGDLSSLQGLDLRGNLLTGAIPVSLTNLSELGLWDICDLRWNKLQTPDNTLDGFLDEACEGGDWSLTQTVPPTSLTVTGAGPTSIDLAWDVIEYTGDTGRYRVWYSQSPDGPFIDGGATVSKLDTTYTLTGLAVYTTYFVTVRTETDFHDFNQNDLVSENSELVSNKNHPDFIKIFSNGFE